MDEGILLVCLNHVVPLVTHVTYKLADVHEAIVTELLEAVVYSEDCT